MNKNAGQRRVYTEKHLIGSSVQDYREKSICTAYSFVDNKKKFNFKEATRDKSVFIQVQTQKNSTKYTFIQNN